VKKCNIRLRNIISRRRQQWLRKKHDRILNKEAAVSLPMSEVPELLKSLQEYKNEAIIRGDRGFPLSRHGKGLPNEK
jgi:hypothetical protein